MKDARVNNLGGLLTRTARLFPSHHAVIAEGKSWTWKEVDQRVQAMASALKNLGIEKGDRSPFSIPRFFKAEAMACTR